MKFTFGSSTLLTEYATLSIYEDHEQECVHIWVNGKNVEIKKDCEHIRIFGDRRSQTVGQGD